MLTPWLLSRRLPRKASLWEAQLPGMAFTGPHTLVSFSSLPTLVPSASGHPAFPTLPLSPAAQQLAVGANLCAVPSLATSWLCLHFPWASVFLTCKWAWSPAHQVIGHLALSKFSQQAVITTPATPPCDQLMPTLPGVPSLPTEHHSPIRTWPAAFPSTLGLPPPQLPQPPLTASAGLSLPAPFRTVRLFLVIPTFPTLLACHVVFPLPGTPSALPSSTSL